MLVKKLECHACDQATAIRKMDMGVITFRLEIDDVVYIDHQRLLRHRDRDALWYFVYLRLDGVHRDDFAD